MPTEFMSTLVELEPFFAKYECLGLLNKEYRNRAPGIMPEHAYRCMALMSENIFYADVDPQRKIQIYKYDSRWNEHKTIQQDNQRTGNFGMAFHKGKLYIMGGSYTERIGIYIDTVESLDLINWNGQTLPNMQYARSSFASVCADKYYIYAIGGRNLAKCMDECERLDIENKKWGRLGRLPNKLHSCAAIEIGGKIYVAGGKDDNDSFSSSIYEFNGTSWSIVSYIISQRQQQVLAKSGSVLFVFLRAENTMVLRYDTVNHIWLGSFSEHLPIIQTIDYHDQMFALCFDGRPRTKKFGKTTLRDQSALEAAVQVSSDVGERGFFYVL